MKKIKEVVKKIIETIKELKKTPKGRAILFFGFYFIFFLTLAILVRMSPRSNNYVDDNSNKKNDGLSVEKVETANYKFNYIVKIDNETYEYVGERIEDKELFTFNGGEYYKDNDEYYKKGLSSWVKVDSPYKYREFLDFKRINEIFAEATSVSKTEFDSGEISYLFKIASASISKSIDGTDIDIDDIPNELNFVSNNEGELYKIELDLSSYGKYKNICKEKFNIVLNYSDFGEVSEIVNPID